MAEDKIRKNKNDITSEGMSQLAHNSEGKIFFNMISFRCFPTFYLNLNQMYFFTL